MQHAWRQQHYGAEPWVCPQVNYFHFVAEEIRNGLASLGLRSLDELVGRTDLLRQRSEPLPKTDGLDLSFLTTFAGKIGSATDRITQPVGAPPLPGIGQGGAVPTS